MKLQKTLAAILCAAASLAYATEENTPLELLIVTGTRIEQPLKQALSHSTVITQKDIQDSQAVDVPSLLKNLAGVEFSQTGGIGKQSGLFMRGANSNQVLVLIDGVRVNSATTGSTALDQIMLDQVERIEVVRGNVSSLYGSEAIGGVIQIFTKRGKGEPAFNVSGGVGSHNTQRLAAGFGGEVGSTAFNVQVSKYKTDGVSAIRPDIVSGVNPDNDGYDNTSLSGNVRHAFNPDNSLTASVFQSHGDVQYDTSYDSADSQHTSTSTLSKFALISDNRFSESWQSKLQLAQGSDDYKDYLNGVQGSSIKTDNRQIGWQNTLAVSSFGSLLLGLENLNQQVTGNTAYTKTERKVNSLFAGYTGNYSAHQVQANIRQDRYSDFGIANTGLLGYGYAINDAWRATASTSTAFKAPTFNDLVYPYSSSPGGCYTVDSVEYCYEGYSYEGNSNLRPERSRNKEIGLRYAAAEQRVDVVYFDNRTRDLIVYDSQLMYTNTGLIQDAMNVGTMVNLNNARSNGIEVSYAGQFGDTGVKAALTSQNPRDTQTGLALVRRAKIFSNLGVTQQLGAWKVGGEWQYSGSREDTHITAWPSTRLTLASYNLVNLTANYDINKQLKLSLRADNLFNQDYMLAHGYNTLGRTLFVGVNYRQ